MRLSHSPAQLSELAMDLTEGEDFYLEDGLMVFTESFLRRRGYCCESGCRHCPWGYRRVPADETNGDTGG